MSFNSRFTRPEGRFFRTRDEYTRLDEGLQTHQQQVGTRVLWYFLEHPGGGPDSTLVDDIYDEGLVTAGKAFHGPFHIPVLSVVTAQGQEQSGDTGFATYDRAVLRLSYEQARRAGLDLDLAANREERLHDRFVWRRRVFDVEAIQTSGHFDPTDRDVTISVTGRQLRTDELYDSPQFQEYVLAHGPSQQGPQH